MIMTPSTPAPQDSPRSSSENSSHDKTPSSRLSDTIATLRNRRRKRKNSNGRLSETERAIQRARQLETTGTQDQATDTDVLRSSGSMAIATLMSRITGFIKNVLLGASLGSAVFSSFNSANQLPNLITEIVLVLSLPAWWFRCWCAPRRRMRTTVLGLFAGSSPLLVCCCWW